MSTANMAQSSSFVCNRGVESGGLHSAGGAQKLTASLPHLQVETVEVSSPASVVLTRLSSRQRAREAADAACN